MVLFSKKNSVILIIISITLVGITFLMQNQKKTPQPEVEITKPQEEIIQQSKKVIGYSVRGRAIEAYSYGSGPTHLLFVGGIHGGYEWNSVLLAYTLMDYLSSNISIIPKHITIDVIPSVNPDAVYVVTGKEGRFSQEDVTKDTQTLEAARFNANTVDLNRNFDCKWNKKSAWRSKTVSGGTAVFSEPETRAVRDHILASQPTMVVFWHSKANSVYASQCSQGILPETIRIMNIYAQASGYKATEKFDAYETTGAADDWLASIGIPAVTVELKTHETLQWEENLAGVKALLLHYQNK